MNLKDQIKTIANEKGMTFKELATKAGLNEKGLHNKFERESITVKDLMKLLAVLEKEIVFKDK